MTESNDGKTLAVTADHGQFLATDDPNVIILRLSNGVLVHNAPGYRTPRVLSFVGHDLPIDLPTMENFRTRGGRDRELTMPELAVVAPQAAQSEERRVGTEWVGTCGYRVA